MSENLRITTYTGGGADILKPNGTYIDFLKTGGVPLNCVFEGKNLIITDFGDIDPLSVAEPMGGRLWKIPVGVRGMERSHGAVA